MRAPHGLPPALPAAGTRLGPTAGRPDHAAVPWRAVSVPPGMDGRADVLRVLSQEGPGVGIGRASCSHTNCHSLHSHPQSPG